jgi:hypothetical protein
VPSTVESAPRVIVGPTQFPSADGSAMISKWEVILDSGAKLLTYSERCFNVINSHIDEDLVFLVEMNSRNPDMPPKITDVRTVAGEELFSAARGKASFAAGRTPGGPAQLAPVPTGGGKFDKAYRNTPEGQRSEQRSIHRSVALQYGTQLALKFVESPTPDDVTTFADYFYDWLQRPFEEGAENG